MLRLRLLFGLLFLIGMLFFPFGSAMADVVVSLPSGVNNVKMLKNTQTLRFY
jgi:hypothetical protein